MQVPYNISVSLARYFDRFYNHRWRVPIFECCPICGGHDCARYIGFYTRHVIDPRSGFQTDVFPIMRYDCRRKGNNLKSADRTFSLLPLQLVPYRKLSLFFMVLAVYEWISSRVGAVNAASEIESKHVHLSEPAAFLYAGALISWRMLLEEGLVRLMELGCGRIGLPELERCGKEERFRIFLKLIGAEVDACERGPDFVVWRYHLLMGGESGGGYFLFGTPSQDRR